MKYQLIPCPDCGSAVELKEETYIGSSQLYSYVHCTNPLCHLFFHSPHFTGSTAEESDAYAARSWNERYAETECVNDSLIWDRNTQVILVQGMARA